MKTEHTGDKKVTAIDGIRYYKSFTDCDSPEYYVTNIKSLAAAWSQDKTFEEIVKILKSNKKLTLIEILAIQEYLNVGKHKGE